MNIIISLIGLGGIILARHLVFKGSEMGIKFHLVILVVKLILSSLTIGLFLIYAENNFWPFLILSGMINIIIFHFIEAFVTQKELLLHRGKNV